MQSGKSIPATLDVMPALGGMTGDDPMIAQAEQYVVDGDGKRTAVILPIKQYERLLEKLHDLAVIAECRQEEANQPR